MAEGSRALQMGHRGRQGRGLGEGGEGHGVGGGVLGVVQEDRLRAGGAGGDQHCLEVLDVLHGLVQNPDL